MTAAPADATTAPARLSGTPTQRAAMARLLLRDALSYLLTATLVMLACLLVGSLIAWWQGWELVGMLDAESIQLRVQAADDGVRVIASLFLLVGAAGIAAVVIPIVLAARARVYVASGATRTSVAVGQLVTLVVMTAYVLVLTAAVLLAVGRGLTGAVDLVRAAGAGGPVVATVRGAGALLLAMTFGSAIVATFLRWPWWVGTVALTVLLAVLPVVVGLGLPELASAVGSAMAWWGFDLVAAVVMAALYWLIMRRVPVR